MDLSEIEKFRDPIFRTSHLYSIRERGGKVIPFRPRPQQSQVLDMIYRRGLKRIVILKARQIGFSTLLGVICADQLCWNTGKQISLVDKTQEDARQKLKNITVLAYDSLHPELKDRFVVSRANSGEFGVRSSNTKRRRPPQCLRAPMPEEAQIFSFGYLNGVSSRRRISGALKRFLLARFRQPKTALL